MDSTNKYDDSAKGGYSFEEKLKLVSDGLMDPKELDLADPEEATEQLPKEPKIESYIAFECSEVPVGLRAQWALKDQKISPANPRGWMADWIENCKDHLIQARMHTGNMQAKLQQTVSEPVLGMIAIMRETADVIEKKYAELQNSKPVSSEGSSVHGSEVQSKTQLQDQAQEKIEDKANE